MEAVSLANFVTSDEAKQIKELLRAGHSIRSIAEQVGCVRQTVRRYKREIGGEFKCPCGDWSTHQGWCWWRYQRSDARQAFIASWHAGRAGMVWPFAASAEIDPTVEFINSVVPKDLPEQVRQEVCQELAVGLLAGAMTGSSEDVRALIRSVWKAYPTKYGPLSLDQSVGANDDRLLRDFVANWHPSLDADYEREDA